MRIGIHSSLEGGDLSKAVRQIVDAERGGFDSFWFGQVFDGDVLTAIALAGGETERIELGTAVLPTYVRHPFLMAQQALTVQAATGGRLTLGIGPSHQPVVEGMWGLSYDRAALHVREYVTVLRSLVHERRVAYSGELYRVNGSLQMPDVEPFPILISALAPMMLRIAGEMSEGTITWMTGPKTIESHIAPRINAAAEKAGRPRPRVVVALPVAVTDDVEDAKQRAAAFFQIYGRLPNYRRMLEKEGAAGPEDVAIVGTEADVEQRLRDLSAAGATDFVCSPFPSAEDGRMSIARTVETLRALVGKI